MAYVRPRGGSPGRHDDGTGLLGSLLGWLVLFLTFAAIVMSSLFLGGYLSPTAPTAPDTAIISNVPEARPTAAWPFRKEWLTPTK